MTYLGQRVDIRSPQQAQSLGISTVYQEVNLCPNLSVAENVLIGRERRRWGRIDWGALNRRADEMLRRLDIQIASPVAAPRWRSSRWRHRPRSRSPAWC
jgi:simple sugar transport system ATP-binding protein